MDSFQKFLRRLNRGETIPLYHWYSADVPESGRPVTVSIEEIIERQRPGWETCSSFTGDPKTKLTLSYHAERAEAWPPTD